MKIFLSYVLDENTPTYGDRDKFTITPKSQIVDGVGANTSTWSFSNNHMGTHMDTPYHFIESGKRTIDYSAEDFCFDNILLSLKYGQNNFYLYLNKIIDYIPLDVVSFEWKLMLIFLVFQEIIKVTNVKDCYYNFE